MAYLTMEPRHRSNVLRHCQMTRTIVNVSSAIVQNCYRFIARRHFLAISIKCMLLHKPRLFLYHNPIQF